MNRDDFVRRLRRYARTHSIPLDADTSKGKGGHAKVRLGDKLTIVKTGELTNFYVEGLLKQLGLPKDALG